DRAEEGRLPPPPRHTEFHGVGERICCKQRHLFPPSSLSRGRPPASLLPKRPRNNGRCLCHDPQGCFRRKLSLYVTHRRQHTSGERGRVFSRPLRWRHEQDHHQWRNQQTRVEHRGRTRLG